MYYIIRVLFFGILAVVFIVLQIKLYQKGKLLMNSGNVVQQDIKRYNKLRWIYSIASFLCILFAIYTFLNPIEQTFINFKSPENALSYICVNSENLKSVEDDNISFYTNIDVNNKIYSIEKHNDRFGFPNNNTEDIEYYSAPTKEMSEEQFTSGVSYANMINSTLYAKYNSTENVTFYKLILHSLSKTNDYSDSNAYINDVKLEYMGNGIYKNPLTQLEYSCYVFGGIFEGEPSQEILINADNYRTRYVKANINKII